MRLENRWGQQVDAIPFAVVALTGLATCYSFGPVYLLTFGVAVPRALVLSTAVYCLVVGAAYYRLVWTYRPEYRSEVSVGVRFRRLVLAMLVSVGVIALFALPLLVE